MSIGEVGVKWSYRCIHNYLGSKFNINLIGLATQKNATAGR